MTFTTFMSPSFSGHVLNGQGWREMRREEEKQLEHQMG
jgi:hypothetical protein